MSRSLIPLLTVAFAATLRAAPFLPAQFDSFHSSGTVESAPKVPDVFREFGFVSSESAEYRGPSGKLRVTAYRMKDATAALAAWDWIRPENAKHCDLADHCAESGRARLLVDANYVLDFSAAPSKSDLRAFSAALPERHPSDLPPVVNYVPLKDLVQNSARYILGPQSLAAVVPELAGADPGFDQGGEAHYTAYRIDGALVRLVLFDYPSPGIARLHTVRFQLVPGTQVKRSTVLVAIVLPGAPQKAGEALLDQVRYQAKILWNEPPPPNPVPALYRLLINIILVSVLLSVLALAAGIMYGLMRLYRRRYGTLEQDEAMTTLHLTGGGE